MAGPGFRHTACGCNSCLKQLHERFARIILPQFTEEDEKNAMLAALREVTQMPLLSEMRRVR